MYVKKVVVVEDKNIYTHEKCLCDSFQQQRTWDCEGRREKTVTSREYKMAATEATTGRKKMIVQQW